MGCLWVEGGWRLRFLGPEPGLSSGLFWGGTAGGGRIPWGRRQAAAHVTGGGGLSEAHQHGTPVHCWLTRSQRCGSHPFGDPQENHVSPSTSPAHTILPLHVDPAHSHGTNQGLLG